MPALALAVVAIALPDSLNPTLIVGALHEALTPRPFTRTLAFTVSAFLVTLAGGFVVAVGLGDLILSLLPKLRPNTKWTLFVVVGTAFVFGAVALWWKRDAVTEDQPPSERAPAHPHAGTGSALLTGAGIAGVEFLTAFPYFAAITMIVGASVPASAKLLLVALYNIIYVLPLIAIVIVCGVMGTEGARRLAPIGDWIAMRWPVVVAPLIGVVGLGLAFYGILQLT
jgi:cytochrome c biogenesis protein CcdA